jgi:hypothetical protein
VLTGGFGGRFWLCGKLQDRRLLTLAQKREQHDPSVRKFKRVVMGGGAILVDLPEDCGFVLDRASAPGKEAGRDAAHRAGEGQFRSWQNADRDAIILGSREAVGAGAKVAGGEPVADLCGTRGDVLQAVVAHCGHLLCGQPHR